VEKLKREGWQPFQLSGQYERHASHEDAYREFTDRVEQIINADVSKFITEVVREKSDTTSAAVAVAHDVGKFITKTGTNTDTRGPGK
jgi:hypothetical protein